MFLLRILANGFVLTSEFVPFRDWEEMLPFENRWYAAFLGMCTHQVLESLPCELHLQVPLHRRCLPGCGPQTSATRDIQTTFVYRLQPHLQVPLVTSEELSPAPFPSGGGWVPCSFLRPFHLRRFRCCCGDPHFRNFLWMVSLRTVHLGLRP